jgi:hypothetical protein
MSTPIDPPPTEGTSSSSGGDSLTAQQGVPTRTDADAQDQIRPDIGPQEGEGLMERSGAATPRYRADQTWVAPDAPDRDVAASGVVRPDTDIRTEPHAPAAADRVTVLARERERFGGMKLGAAFFGWLAATGLAVLLIAVLAAAGVAFGVTNPANVDKAVQESQNATGTAKTVGLVGAIVLLVILFLAYYCGGYVAGRMARFSGFKQGFAVWLWAIFTSAIIAAVAAIAGAKYNVLAQLNLPRIPVQEGSVTAVGLIAIAAAVLVSLIAALIGGKMGTRFHRKIDAVGFEDR